MSGLTEPGELEPEQGTLHLSSPDDVYDASDWEAATAAVLRKARRLGEDDPDSAVWQELTRTTLDGIAVAPVGSPASVASVETAGRPAREGEWDIRTPLGGSDPKALNEAALVDLENGATSVWLRPDPGADPAQVLGGALEGVLVDLAPVVLDTAEPLSAAEALVSVADARDVDLHPGTNFAADPIGDAVRAGGHPASAGQLDAVVALARRAGVRAIVVDATAVHDLGASDGQELGYALATAAAYLRGLVDSGLTVQEAARLVEFRFAATDEQFPTIAKLRAARRLWARVLELSGVPAAEQEPQRQHVVTSRPMMSKYDPWVNMLRTTIAAFAAGVGGADAVTVLPFDSPLGRPDAFGRRVARNTSSLLMAESHLARVTDPAGGSYAVERLTDDLARSGWEELDRLEAAGGIEAALSDGSLRARIDEVVARRDAEIATRARPLTGVSEFPNLGEELPRREPDPTAPQVRRYGAPFEAMRDEPATQPVFLATMGTIAAHTARATWATNLLAAGGVAVTAAGATDDVPAVLAAHREAGGPAVVCLAGADTDYAAWGADLVAALRRAGASYVVLAGKAGDRTVSADVLDDSAAVGVDAIAFLTRIREELAQ